MAAGFDLQRPAFAVTCPICQTAFPPALRTGRQPCPNCGTRLMPRRRYGLVAVSVALIISVLIAFAIGVPREWMLIAVSLIASLITRPIQLIVMFVTVRRFPLELEPTGDVQGILYGDQERFATGTPDTPTPSPEVRFDASKKPWTIEDGLMALFLGALVLGIGLWSFSPLIVGMFPEFGATRTGPAGFPVTVHIDRRVITFTNGSTASWTCRAALKEEGRPIAAAVFVVEPGRTHGVSYADFIDARAVSDDELEAAARAGVELVCREPSGRRHFATLGIAQQYIR